MKNNSLSRIDDQNGSWKGEEASYTALHQWIYRRKGHPDTCEDCGKVGSGKQIQWANISGNYLRDIDDYKALCASCHKKLDYARKYGNACMKGHEFTQENTRLEYRSDGVRRICRMCTNLRARAWRLQNA